MARTNGCPFSIRNWQIDIQSRASTPENPVWIRIKGLTEMALSLESETQDAADADSLFSERFKTRLSVKLNLEGKPVGDAASGEMDPGQALLTEYAMMAGCQADARLRLADPYGRAQIMDVIVSGFERKADDSSQSVAWEMDMVGAPQQLSYIQAQSVATTPSGSLSITLGQTKPVGVSFTPQNASNQKYSVASADPAKVKVTAVDGLNFELFGAQKTESPVNIVVKTMNNALTANLQVTVSEA